MIVEGIGVYRAARKCSGYFNPLQYGALTIKFPSALINWFIRLDRFPTALYHHLQWAQRPPFTTSTMGYQLPSMVRVTDLDNADTAKWMVPQDGTLEHVRLRFNPVC